MNKRISITGLVIVIVLAALFAGCPASSVEELIPDMPQADTTTMPRLNDKMVSFTLTSIHSVNAVWKAYDSETGGTFLVDVDVSYLPSLDQLTLIARGNVLATGIYWISVSERGTDESARLGLTVVAQ